MRRTPRYRIPRGRTALASLLSITMLLCFVAACSPHPASTGENRITAENEHAGSVNWQIRNKAADGVGRQIEGYASATSVNIGSSIAFNVSVSPAQSYSIDIYRMGYYQGLGGRLMQRISGLTGKPQARCPADPVTGMVSCPWPASYSLSVPPTWTTGIYLAKLINALGFQSYVTFAVRDDRHPGALLYQQSVNTYQAYNGYPQDDVPGRPPRTGKSLYEGSSSAAVTRLGTTRAVMVSFDRPYASDHGAGNFLDWEFYFVLWIEMSGFDVSYSTDVDTHANGANLLRYKGFLSVGHDEYWSKQMYDSVTRARDAGVSLGFFGANAIYWQVRFKASASGVPNRVIVCYKDADLDPVKGPLLTVRWRDPQLNRPEQGLVGIQFNSEEAEGGTPAALVPINTSNWVYSGSTAVSGRPGGTVVGYETDHQFADTPLPRFVAGTYALLSRSPYVNSDGSRDLQNAVVYQAPSGAWVFGAGTIEWSWGLAGDDAHDYVDPTVQHVTAQVIRRFLDPRTPPPKVPAKVTATLVGSDTAELRWTDRAGNADQYVIERSLSADFTGSTSVTLPGTDRSFQDRGLTAPLYYYRIRAQSRSGNSPTSATIIVATVSYERFLQQQTDLLARWRLAELGRGKARDEVGKRTGSYVGGVAPDLNGPIAGDPHGVTRFDGRTGTVRLPTLPPLRDFTLLGWANLARAGAGNENGNNALYAGDRTVRLLVRPGAVTAALAAVWLTGKEYPLQPDAAVSNVGRWTMWALSRSGSVLTLYRDGIRVAQRRDLPATAQAVLDGWIGSQDGQKYLFNGSIGEVTIFDTGLSAGAIKVLRDLANADTRP
jgi:hypothetical protein